MKLSFRAVWAVAVVGVAALLSGCCTHCRPIADTSTPWMRPAEFSAFLQEKEGKGADGKNFWSRGHWVSAVEARWHEGYPQHRLRIERAPVGQKYWWYWWFDQTPAEFGQHLRRLAAEDFQLVHSYRLEWPDGTVRHGGVWHKVAAE